MSQEDDLKLEKLIKEIFFNSRRESVTPKKVRLNNIIKRGLYETAFKDLIIFVSQLLNAMFVMFSQILNLFTAKTK